MSSQTPESTMPAQGLDLDSLKSLLQEASPARIIVATDWSRPSTAFALTQSYANLFSAGAAVELVFSVNREPGDEDLACVQVLVEEIEAARELATVKVESYQETAGQPYDVSVVAMGDRDVLLIEVATAITRMAALASGSVPHDEQNRGDLPALARRLASYTEN